MFIDNNTWKPMSICVFQCINFFTNAPGGRGSIYTEKDIVWNLQLVAARYLRWRGSGRRWAASSDTPALTAVSEQTPADSPGRPTSCSAAGGGGWTRGGTPVDQHWRGPQTDLMLLFSFTFYLEWKHSVGKKRRSYLRLRPCITARGPEDTGPSWVGRQLLKSAHWSRESPLSAIRVLRDTEEDSLTLFWKSSGHCSIMLQYNHILLSYYCWDNMVQMHKTTISYYRCIT